MPPDSRDAAHLWDMLAAAREAGAVVEGITLDAFLEDRLRLRALERTLELVGEAARRVSPACQSSNPEIPWRPPKGTSFGAHPGYGITQRNLIWVRLCKQADGYSLTAPH